jgi:CHASE3 domain sensor protein
VCSGIEAGLERYNTALPKIDLILEDLSGRAFRGEGEQLLKEIMPLVRKRLVVLKQLLDHRRERGVDTASVDMVNEGETYMMQLHQRIKRLYNLALEDHDARSRSTQHSIHVLWIASLAALVGLLFLLSLAIIGALCYKNRAKLESRNNKLRLALSAAEETMKLKSAFLANISHELRTVREAQQGSSQL